MADKPSIRIETDSLGEVEVPSASLWGAQTQRSLHNFAIGQQTFPLVFIYDFVRVKKAAAIANCQLGTLEVKISELITSACDEILAGKYDGQFPLSVWQTGSGTQTNMNVNEVIANIANLKTGAAAGSQAPVHPNDHVNLSQSSNDVFPTVMHVVTTRLLHESLLPSLAAMLAEFADKQDQFAATLKIGRTHMMDATPITLGQEFGAFHAQLEFARNTLQSSLIAVAALAIGGTAVGTGLNSRKQWPETVVEQINSLTGYQFTPAANKFSQLAAHDALTNLHGQLTLLATSLFKIANDIRLMNSGPRCGLAEISLPANEPGSSIMPGKVNPTQVEALTMVCLRVIGNNTAVVMANSQGQFQLNVYKPLLIVTVMESIGLLSDAMTSFTRHCVAGLTANAPRLAAYLEQSLMLVTALTPVIGYDRAAAAAKHAHEQEISLKQSVVDLGFLSAEEFDAQLQVDRLAGPDD